MKYLKGIKTSLLIILICFCTFCSGYTMGSSFVFADDVTDEWENVTTNAELVEAFRYYCKSRDLTIDGSIANGVTQFTTKAFNGICNTLGIDMTAIQANIKYNVDSNGIKRFLFTNDIISTYNRIFAQFLQDNDLEVGDSANEQDNTVYSGYIYTDADGINTLVWMVSSTSVNTNYNFPNQYITARGNYYKYTRETLMALVPNNGSTTVTFHLTNNTTFTGRVKRTSANTTTLDTVTYEFYQDGNTINEKYIGDYKLIKSSQVRTTYSGYPCIFYSTDTNKFYMGVYALYSSSDNTVTEGIGNLRQFNVTNSNYQSATVYLTTNNTVINNNNYEGDTIINNNGTPSTPTPPVPDPEPDYSPAEDWDIELPDLSVPNWILSGKENKFPFDIPFNVMYALSLLQAEPEAPRVEGTLDFGFTTWEYDLDLSDFDSVAEICRDMEFLAFLTGLMLMTRKLIWG